MSCMLFPQSILQAFAEPELTTVVTLYTITLQSGQVTDSPIQIQPSFYPP